MSWLAAQTLPIGSSVWTIRVGARRCTTVVGSTAAGRTTRWLTTPSAGTVSVTTGSVATPSSTTAGSAGSVTTRRSSYAMQIPPLEEVERGVEDDDQHHRDD